MAKNTQFNQVEVPVTLATQMAQIQMEQVINQIMGPDRPQRQMRLGDQPAAPIVQSIVEMIPEA
jgi:hypothetical protein